MVSWVSMNICNPEITQCVFLCDFGFIITAFRNQSRPQREISPIAGTVIYTKTNPVDEAFSSGRRSPLNDNI